METSSKTTTVLLGIGLVVAIVIAYPFVDHHQVGWPLVYWSAVGTNVTLLGVGYTLFQISRIRAESAIIAKTAFETRELLFRIGHYGDLAKALKLIPEVQGYARSVKYELAVMRLQELKIILGQIRAIPIPSVVLRK